MCGWVNKSVAVELAIVYSSANLLRSFTSNMMLLESAREQLIKIWEMLSCWPGSSTLEAKLSRISLAYSEALILSEGKREEVRKPANSLIYVGRKKLADIVQLHREHAVLLDGFPDFCPLLL